MQWLKFSLLIILSFNVQASKKFTSNECLKSKFETEIKNEGKFFGLIKNKLEIEKDKCEIVIEYKDILETKWKIDLCREPIHIKLTSKGTQSVHKRIGECKSPGQSDYCKSWDELRTVLQDYGLIYAEGEREVISTAHGQTYCTYLLLNEYLENGTLFSKFNDSKNLFSMNSDESCEIKTKPTVIESDSVLSNSPKTIEPQKAEPIVKEDTPARF